MAERTVLRTWCSLCTRWDLPVKKWRGQLWVYCPTRADGPEEAHTAFPIRKYAEHNDDIEVVTVDLSKHGEQPEEVVPVEPAAEVAK